VVTVSQLARQFLPVVDLLYPPRCPACGTAIASQDGLCGSCWSALEAPSISEQGHGAVPVYAAAFYNEMSRRLVLAYKHGGRIALARLLARLMAVHLPGRPAGQRLPVLVPVPLHRWRMWQRGFNQAALLTIELERMGRGEAELAALVRHKRTPNLGGLGREARERTLNGAIKLNPALAHRLKGRDVIIVDDVLTSGATTRACSAAISEAGAVSISVVCFALVNQDHR